MNAAMSAAWQRVAAALPMAVRVLTVVIAIAVIALLVKLGARIEWQTVFQAAREIPERALLAGAGLVVAGYAVYAGIDGLARRFLRHALPLHKTLAIAAISYAINLNLGVLLGSVGVRLRLYHQSGLGQAMAARVVLFGSVTNWLGYCWLAGFLFMAGPVDTLARWGIGPATVRAIGAVILAAGVVYLFLCAASVRVRWGRRFARAALPPFRMALAQSGLAIASWSLMGAIVYVLLGGRVPYPEALAILLFCSIAAMVAHIPGGLGVTEAIFVAALSGRLPGHEVLAAILMYRVLYQWLPLGFALPAYLALELHARRNRRASPPARQGVVDH